MNRASAQADALSHGSGLESPKHSLRLRPPVVAFGALFAQVDASTPTIASFILLAPGW